MSYMTRSKRILLSLEKNDTKRLESLESYNVAPSYESLRGSTSKEQNKLLKNANLLLSLGVKKSQGTKSSLHLSVSKGCDCKDLGIQANSVIQSHKENYKSPNEETLPLDSKVGISSVLNNINAKDDAHESSLKSSLDISNNNGEIFIEKTNEDTNEFSKTSPAIASRNVLQNMTNNDLQLVDMRQSQSSRKLSNIVTSYQNGTRSQFKSSDVSYEIEDVALVQVTDNIREMALTEIPKELNIVEPEVIRKTQISSNLSNNTSLNEVSSLDIQNNDCAYDILQESIQDTPIMIDTAFPVSSKVANDSILKSSSEIRKKNDKVIIVKKPNGNTNESSKISPAITSCNVLQNLTSSDLQLVGMRRNESSPKISNVLSSSQNDSHSESKSSDVPNEFNDVRIVQVTDDIREIALTEIPKELNVVEPEVIRKTQISSNLSNNTSLNEFSSLDFQNNDCANDILQEAIQHTPILIDTCTTINNFEIVDALYLANDFQHNDHGMDVLFPVQNVILEVSQDSAFAKNCANTTKSSLRILSDIRLAQPIKNSDNFSYPNGGPTNGTRGFPPSDEEDDHETNAPKKLRCENLELMPTKKRNVSGDICDVNGHEANISDIFIRSSQKNQYGLRIRQKAHCCLFCHKLYNDVTKHIKRKHANEEEVLKLLLMDKKSEGRRNGFLQMTREGDYFHNCDVLTKKSGELILARLPTPAEIAIHKSTDYSPCPNCLGFMLKKHLWHHVKYGCTVKRSTVPFTKRIISESTALLVHTFTDIPTSEEFSNNIIIPLKNDVISMTCRQDSLIVKFGAMQFEKYHTTQNDLIRQSMRQLGRLLIELRAQNEKLVWLSDWLKPKYFDQIVTAVKKISHATYTVKSRPSFDIPSLALKLGYSLKKCISIQKGICLRKENFSEVETLNAMLSIMELEWSIKISSSALATMSQRKINCTELLPLTEDLIRFNKHLNKNIALAKSNLNEDINYNNWSRLASLVLAKMILFNKRRSGEASRMTVHQYTSRPNWGDASTAEFKNSFSDFEKELALKLVIVQIIGKRGRIVNVLLSNEIKASMDLLLLHRNKFIIQENPHFFGRSSPSTEHIRGHDCLRNLAVESELSRPDLVNATRLRKYVATVCQVFDLSENETDWLAKHLGHDIRVHREFYRLHDSTVELTKISRILLAIENGKAHLFSGKKLDDINICDLPDMELENVTTQDEGNNSNEADVDVDDYIDRNNRCSTEMEIQNFDEGSSEIEDVVETKSHGKKQKQKKQQNGRTKFIRKRWSQEQANAILTYFSSYIKKNSFAPGKALCEECFNENRSIMQNRTWKDIKYFIYNHIKRVSKGIRAKKENI